MTSSVDQSAHPPAVAIVANSGAGKTTLLKKLLAFMRSQGLRVAVIKHSHHNVDIDKPDKDSHQLRQAGAEHMVLVSPYRLAHVQEFNSPEDEISLDEVLARLPADLDAILIEGYKNATVKKIELHRSALGAPHLHQNDPNVRALITDDLSLSASIAKPVFSHDDMAAISAFILNG